MKKLKLKALQLGATEILSREQLKTIMGGSGGGNGSCTFKCPGGLKECTSSTGDCKEEKNGVVVVSISCDGITYKC
ncbi:MAG: hypothetical protein IT249_02745 [Chitinophagaceae bacterium]|nr:hypothetical protein [Chitinophagaceae bacterium]